MRLSFNWLCEYVDLSGLTAHEVAEKLTHGAFEVEEVRAVGVQGPLVLGQILEIQAIPKADKIRLTRVRVEPDGAPLEIICGAMNIEVGQHIPVALPGSIVLNRMTGEPLKIEVTKKMGVISNGMLCSPPELGMPGGAESGILVLSDFAGQLGDDLKAPLALQSDHILHVEPRSNRGDALSVIGLAREVAALTKRDLKEPVWGLELPESAQLTCPVEIENGDDCALFTIRVIEGLKVGPSPRWLTDRLESVGVRSVNNIVDITNYVMHEFGQPLHAYDLAKLAKVAGHKLSVRRARQNEVLTTLDGKERKLTEEMLVIADGEGVVGVAGVMGGKESEISDTTETIALEAAAFSAARVRRTSRLVGLSSDSSLRFERGVDRQSTARASDRAAYLLLRYCLGDQSEPKIGALCLAGSDEVEERSVDLRMSQLKRILDIEFKADQVKELIAPLGFSSQVKSEDLLSVSVPSFRQNDVTREIDLVEEVCRLWGYERLPVRMPSSTLAPPIPDDSLERIKNFLAAQGFSEAWISSLTSADESSVFKDYSAQVTDKLVRVLNPLSEEHQVLRQSLLPGLLRCAVYNQDRGSKDVWMFESGRTYEKADESDNTGGDASLQPAFSRGFTGVKERQCVAGLSMGRRNLSIWSKEESGASDFYTVKGLVESLVCRLGIDAARLRFYKGEGDSYLHPFRGCRVGYNLKSGETGKGAAPSLAAAQPVSVARAGSSDSSDNHKERGQRSGGKSNADQKREARLLQLGWLGQVHPGLADRLGLKQEVFVFELDVDILARLRGQSRFVEIPATPQVVRDLTVDVVPSVDHASLASCISASAGSSLQEVSLVSIYQPSEATKSLSFRLNFQDMQRTLTNEEVEQTMTRIKERLSKSLAATFRV